MRHNSHVSWRLVFEALCLTLLNPQRQRISTSRVWQARR